MRVLGIESSCDETGVALYDSAKHQLLAHALHSQVDMHQAYGGVVPELASRDHIRRTVPLIETVLDTARYHLADIDVVAYTQGPGLAGALLVGAGVAHGLAFALDRPLIGIHHLEGHLLSPLLSPDPPEFPFVALLVSGGHTQLMRVDSIGRYRLLGETQDDAAGEAFDKTAKLLGLPYPGGPALSRLAQFGVAGAWDLPRPMLRSENLDFSFSGLKTAVVVAVKNHASSNLCEQAKADLALAFEEAITEVLVSKSMRALEQEGLNRLVVAGGVGANQRLRHDLKEAGRRRGAEIYFPELEWCTDNGAMIALAGALRIEAGVQTATRNAAFTVRPRWDLGALARNTVE